MSKKRKGLLQRILMLILIVCMVCGNAVISNADEAVAAVMRLTKTEGTVSVTNKNGRDMGTMADMKLFHGYHLATAQRSYAWMNLDDRKMVKLDAASEAEIQKRGKDLEILLDSGNLLFNVTESLKADETLNVRTSTMVTGIRGTCGWVKVINSSRTQVYILEGRVECYVMDPVSGQKKNITLRSGDKADLVVYDQTRAGDKCDILVEHFNEKDVDGFVAMELKNDPELLKRVDRELDIDLNWLVTNAPMLLEKEQKEVEQKYAVITEVIKQQADKVVKDPVFRYGREEEDEGDDRNTGSGSSGGSGGGNSGGSGSESGGGSGSGDNGGSTDVPETLSVAGSKIWDDGNDQDGKRPEEIIVKLLADGKLVEGRSVTATADNGWSWIFSDLPKYANGEEIYYSVYEEAVAGYSATYPVDGFDIINTHVPETVEVSGSKTWDDSEDQDGKRPAEITIHLLANDEEVAEKTVSAADNWKWSFTDLPKYKNGVEIAYTITEDEVAGYASNVNGYDVINTYSPETTEVVGYKSWNDGNDQDGKRPESVTIRLYANGTEVGSQTVTETDGWSWSFTDLPKYSNGADPDR